MYILLLLWSFLLCFKVEKPKDKESVNRLKEE